jgi:hypothetical protein
MLPAELRLVILIREQHRFEGVPKIIKHGWIVRVAGHYLHPGSSPGRSTRVKNDERDAADLADLLRMGRLPQAWVAPPVTP